jgi:KipI family sensor histidine kinase inhibitor
MRIVAASDSSLLVSFGDTISDESHTRVIALFRGLQARRDARIKNLHPAYASLLIDFDPLKSGHDELQLLAEEVLQKVESEDNSSPNPVTIPVCYEAEYAPDLSDVAAHAKLSTEEVIRLHSSSTYVVYFLGFSPGFAYMGVLPPELRVPRLATPRTHVLAGSVAIAGEQTAVYPVDSPGGWRLIGRTPTRLFDPDAAQPSRCLPGDRVRFTPIDRATFSEMSRRG